MPGCACAWNQKQGRELDWRESGILGCDSVQNAVHRGRLFWAWGDSTIPNYPLGIFDMTSATTEVKPLSSFEPPLRLKLDFFTDDKSKPRGVARMPGSGTYTMTFADRPAPTPRYDYNQLLYRLDLDDPALRPARGN